MFNTLYNNGFVGNNNSYLSPGSIGVNRCDFNSRLGCMVPVSSNGRFDYSNPIYNSSGHDLRTPLQRDCVRPQMYKPVSPLKELCNSFKLSVPEPNWKSINPFKPVVPDYLGIKSNKKSVLLDAEEFPYKSW